MSTITWDRINNDVESIINELNDFLDKNQYDEANGIVNEIMSAFDGTFGVELNNAPDDNNQIYDNKVHEVYSKIREALETRAAGEGKTLEELLKTKEYEALRDSIKQTADTFFKTSEVRSALLEKDPEEQEYLDALQEYIDETESEKDDNNKKLEEVQNLKNVLIIDPKSTSKDKNTRTEYLKDLKEIASIIEQINNPAYVKDPRYKTRIDNWKLEIEQKVQDLKNAGIDTTKIDKITKKTPIKDDEVQNLIEKQYDEIRKQLLSVQKGSNTYTDIDGNEINLQNNEIIKNLPSNIDTIDMSDKNSQKVIDDILVKIEDELKQITDKKNTLDVKRDVFQHQIDLIEVERQVLARDINSRDEYLDALKKPEHQSELQKIEDEKEERAEDAKAKSGIDRKLSKEYATRYKKAWKEFQSHRKTVNGIAKYEDFNFEKLTFEKKDFEYSYDKIDDESDYPDKSKDMTFMQIDSWEERAERIGKYETIGINAYIDENYKIRVRNKINELKNIGKTNDEIKGEMEEFIGKLNNEYEQIHKREEDYVKNFNSSHFHSKESVAILKTGGSAMMVKGKEKGEITMADRARAFFKYTSFKKKADGKRHIIRTCVSNIGGLVSLPVRLIETGIGLGAAAVRYTGSKINGTYNMPTPYKVGSGARKEARQEYYLNHGSTNFGAWLKSWFNLSVEDESGNKVKLDKKLLTDRIEEVNLSIENKYIRYARAKLIEEQIKARENKRIRNVAYRDVASGAEVYEDIHREARYGRAGQDLQSDTFKKNTRSEVIRRSAELHGKTDEGEIGKVMRESFVKGGPKRQGKFKRDPKDGQVIYEDTRNVTTEDNFRGTIGETLWTNYVSRENIFRAHTKKIDRGLKIAAAATIAGAKYFIANSPIFKNPNDLQQGDDIPQNTTTTVTTQPKTPQHTTKIDATPKTRQEITYQDHVVYGVRDVYKDVPQTQTVQLDYANAKVGNCVRGDTAYWSSDLGAHTAHQAGTFAPDDTVVQGINFRFTDPTTGNPIAYSIGDMNIKAYIDSHPNCSEFASTYANLGITNDTPLSKLVDFLPDDIKQKYIQAMNSSGNKLQFSNDTMQLAYGRGTTMGKGWSDANVPLDSVREVTKMIKTKVGQETYPIHVKSKVVTEIPITPESTGVTDISSATIKAASDVASNETAVKAATNIASNVTQAQQINGQSSLSWINSIPSSVKKINKGNKMVLVGTAGVIAQIWQQALNPFFSKKKKSVVIDKHSSNGLGNPYSQYDKYHTYESRKGNKYSNHPKNEDYDAR